MGLGRAVSHLIQKALPEARSFARTAESNFGPANNEYSN